MDGEVVVSRLQTPYEAELAANYLREHGLAVRIDNDVLQGMNPLWGMALGGVRVYVPIADSERAKALLEELERPSPENSEPREDPSERTREFDAAARRALAAAVIGSFLLPVVAQIYSLFIALRLRPAQLGSRGRRHWALALAVDGLVLGGCLFWLLRRT
jgi:hypothetical protein